MDLVVRQHAHRLRRLGCEAFESVYGRQAVDHAGQVGQVDLVGDHVSPGQHVERDRIPYQIRIVIDRHHFEARFSGLEIPEKLALVLQHGEADRVRLGRRGRTRRR